MTGRTNSAWAKAIEGGYRFYYGRVCAKHPELEGKRYTMAGCLSCVKEVAAKTRGNKRAREREERKGQRYKNRPPMTEQHKAAIRRANTGRKHTPEELAKMRAYVFTPEHLANLKKARNKR